MVFGSSHTDKCTPYVGFQKLASVNNGADLEPEVYLTVIDGGEFLRLNCRARWTVSYARWDLELSLVRSLPLPMFVTWTWVIVKPF